MASLVSSTQPSATAASQDKEDRFSRLTRPTRSSSQKAVEASPRPTPKRPPGLTKAITSVSAEAGRRPRATSIALTKPVGQSAKPIIRNPTQYGHAIPRPAVSKNAALASSSARPILSPPKSAATLVKNDEPPLAAVQQDRIPDQAVTTEDVVEPAVHVTAEGAGGVETEEPVATDAQPEHALGETPLIDAVPVEQVESYEVVPTCAVTTAEEPPSNEVEELESHSTGFPLIGSSFEAADVQSESSSPEVSDVALTDTVAQEEIADAVPANEATTAPTVATLIEPAIPVGDVEEGRSPAESEIHEDGMVATADSGSAVTVVSEGDGKPDSEVNALDIISEDTILQDLDQVDSPSKLVDSGNLSTPEEAPLPKDGLDDDGDVSQPTEDKNGSSTDGDDTNNLASNINENAVVEGKANDPAPMADRFVHSA